MTDQDESKLELAVDAVDLGSLKAEDFEPLLDQAFKVDLRFFGLSLDGLPQTTPKVYPDRTSWELELVEVTRRDPFYEGAKQPFSLLFRGGHELPLYADVHVVKHDAIGQMTLLLTPVNVSPNTLPEKHPEGRFYETIFN